MHVAAPLAPLATTVLAYYAIAIGARWKTVHPELVALVVPLLDGMTGDNDSKLLRMRAIIDRVVTEARRLGRRTPTPRYIFNPPFFWRRLDRLRDERGRLDGASPPLPAPCRPRNAGASGVGEHAPSLANGRTDAELAASGWSAEEITELRAIELDARSRHGLLTKRAAENEYKTRRH